MTDWYKFGQMVGRTITGVIVKRSQSGEPHSQVFLLFSDGTYSELYSWAEIQPAKLWPGGPEEVRSYMAEGTTIVYERLAPEGATQGDDAS